MSDFTKDLVVLSRCHNNRNVDPNKGKEPPQLIRGRLAGVQALEGKVRAMGGMYATAEAKGNSAIREFIEGAHQDVVWGDYRIDAVKETK